ncbi:MAG: NUMOD4 motif-containing HNH endonuclease [Clostridiales bacterium]|nr:NUMOD4 motif-containing HNH endonuclease [Clostridiales bacterium]
MKSYVPLNQGPNWWRDIPGYGGKYQVSRLGEIRRVYPSGKVRDMTPYKKAGCNGRKISRDRLYVKLTIDGRSKDVPMLQIMTATFKGPVPAGYVPYHINGMVTDNRAENIGFIGRRELGQKTGHLAGKRKAVFKVNEQGEDVEVYRSAREAAKANYVSYQTVLDRCHGKVKNPYALDGYTYRFEE